MTNKIVNGAFVAAIVAAVLSCAVVCFATAAGAPAAAKVAAVSLEISGFCSVAAGYLKEQISY